MSRNQPSHLISGEPEAQRNEMTLPILQGTVNRARLAPHCLLTVLRSSDITSQAPRLPALSPLKTTMPVSLLSRFPKAHAGFIASAASRSLARPTESASAHLCLTRRDMRQPHSVLSREHACRHTRQRRGRPPLRPLQKPQTTEKCPGPA